MGFFNRNQKVWNKSPGDPVSEADLASNALLRERLLGARPDYGWLSEETTDDQTRLSAPRTFIVDPIDGTRAFVKGREEFCISLAVAEGGIIKTGVIYDPARDQLFAARRGQGATCNDTPITMSDTDRLKGSRLLGDPGKLADLRSRGADATTFNSVALRLARVAMGDFDGLVSVREKWDWDIAAGQVLIEEAGGIMTGLRGEVFQYDSPTPRKPAPVAAGPRLHRLLLKQTNESL